MSFNYILYVLSTFHFVTFCLYIFFFCSSTPVYVSTHREFLWVCFRVHSRIVRCFFCSSSSLVTIIIRQITIYSWKLIFKKCSTENRKKEQNSTLNRNERKKIVFFLTTCNKNINYTRLLINKNARSSRCLTQTLTHSYISNFFLKKKEEKRRVCIVRCYLRQHIPMSDWSDTLLWCALLL